MTIRDDIESGALVWAKQKILNGVLGLASRPSQSSSNGVTPSPSNDANRPYVYSGLRPGGFRLFMLFPGKKKDPLRGMIFTCASIDSAPPYQALSYEWGPETRERN